ncbi:MAG: glycogen debranching enzyme [Ruminococcus sp.]|nr:glycogen debranching enzyme [Ruminococcus sp.]
MKMHSSTIIDTAIRCTKGDPSRLGASVCQNERGEEGINFALYSEHARGCILVLFYIGDKEPMAELPFTEEMKDGNVYAMFVTGIDPEQIEYGYRVDGDYDLSCEMRYQNQLVLLDPYAKSVSGRNCWCSSIDPGRAGKFRGRVVADEFDWEGDTCLDIPLKDLIIYEAHVRSMTMHESAEVTAPGTFAGLMEKIPYLRSLGINCIELLPVFEFDEMEYNRFYNQKRILNYWGYSTLNFFSPKAGYAASGMAGGQVQEFKEMVKAFHKAGIRVLLDVVYNHTAEGEEKDRCYSFQGIDNPVYYISQPDGKNTNYSGCGNTFKCNHPAVRQLILDSLRYWHKECHVDGFRFDLAPMLVRDVDGVPDWENPVAREIAEDEILKDAILIAEPWDAAGLYLTGRFHHWGRWSEWNDKYRDAMRQFINGNSEYAPDFMGRIAGSENMYAQCGAQGSINFVTCHDGFTMYDLVAYNTKHNESNGEQNRDGNNWNISYNNGWEGFTPDPHIHHMRRRKMKSLFALLMTSRGVPMMYAGDEICNTQYGNNNAYCQDSHISWIDWSGLEREKDMLEFVRMMVEFRKAHPVLRNTSFDTGCNGTGYPELSFRYPGGTAAFPDKKSHCIAAFYAEDHVKYGTEEDCFIYVICNVYSHDISYLLPDADRIDWTVLTDSSTRNRYGDKPGDLVVAEPYAVVVLTGKRRG